jgi:hypothetical protein
MTRVSLEEAAGIGGSDIEGKADSSAALRNDNV